MNAHTSGTTARHRHREDGSALLMALVFIAVVALVTTAMVTRTTASLRATSVVREHTDQLYAADAGLAHAIEVLRLDHTLCSSPQAGSMALPPIEIDGREVTLACETTSGTSTGAGGWAVITTQASGLRTQSAHEKRIDGPVYAADLASGAELDVLSGNLLEDAATSGCSPGAAEPSGIDVGPPPFEYRCVNGPTTAAGVAASVPHALPAAVPPPAPAPVDLPAGCSGNACLCRVFSPGTYAAAPALDNENYFRSGTYYFASGTISIENGTSVVGGARGAFESQLTAGVPACQTAIDADTADGTGVHWIFGGTARLDVKKGEIELFSRQGGPASEGQAGIALRAVLSTEAATGFLPSTAIPLVDVSGGTNPELVAHGMVYAPTSTILFSATNTSQAQLRGGVVAGVLELQSSASASGLIVTHGTSLTPRVTEVRATAASSTGGVAVTAEAVIELPNAPSGDTLPLPAQVLSWTVGRDTGGAP